MQTTLELLAKAEEIKDLSAWADTLGLTKRALYTAKYRGNLSPAIAGALAEEMGLDPKEWIVTAALESERDSTCKTRMIRRFLGGAAIAVTGITPASAATLFDLGTIKSLLCKVANANKQKTVQIVRQATA